MSDTPEADAAIKDQSKWMRPFVSTTFDGITYDSPVASLCRKLERERDEARAERDILRLDAQREAEHHDRMVGELEKVYKERDEARAAIPAGEWVAYDDHQKVHNAASRLLVAINKQLPIGSFSLISHEYHALKDAIYGREEAQ
jgi:hypothetical protein